MDMKKIIYVSGQYTNNNPRLVRRNIEKALHLTAKLLEKGWTVICPHANYAGLEKARSGWPKLKYDVFLSADLVLLEKCDAIIMLKDWEQSKGAGIEKEYAEMKKIPVFFETEGLPSNLKPKGKK